MGSSCSSGRKARLIKISKCQPGRFYSFNQVAFDKALAHLSKNAFAFWCICAKNADGFMLNISKRTVANSCGFSERTYARAFDELWHKGYITSSSEGHYIFFEGGFIDQYTEISKWNVSMGISTQNHLHFEIYCY